MGFECERETGSQGGGFFELVLLFNPATENETFSISSFFFSLDIFEKKCHGRIFCPVCRKKIGEKRQMFLSTIFNASTCELPRLSSHKCNFSQLKCYHFK
jgi:hypothetical protein